MGEQAMLDEDVLLYPIIHSRIGLVIQRFPLMKYRSIISAKDPPQPSK